MSLSAKDFMTTCQLDIHILAILSNHILIVVIYNVDLGAKYAETVKSDHNLEYPN
jgi:hypothetical protein